MYYNDQQKLRYIKQSDMPESSEEVFKRILSTATKVENQEGTDLSNFNRQQVINLLKAYNSKSRGYLRVICNYYSDYYSWCLSERLVDITNVTNWYDNTLSKSIVSEVLPNELIEDKFFTRETLIECVSRVMDKTNKLLLYAPFCGIDGEDHSDLRYLKIEDLDEQNKKMKLLSGKTVSVDDLFIQLLKDANAATRYDENGMGEVSKKEWTQVYGESKYVFKVCNVTSVDAILTGKTINGRFTVIKKQAGNQFLTMSLIYKNGLINYIKDYYEKQNLSLYDALFEKNPTVKRAYKYDEKTQELISEYGSNMTARMLRHQMTDIVQYF